MSWLSKSTIVEPSAAERAADQPRCRACHSPHSAQHTVHVPGIAEPESVCVDPLLCRLTAQTAGIWKAVPGRRT